MSEPARNVMAMSADQRARLEAVVLVLVAEFVGDLTGLRPPTERSLFPPEHEPALWRLCDGLIQAVRECT